MPDGAHLIYGTGIVGQVLGAAARKVIDEDRFPMSPRLDPLKSALAKLDPGSVVPERKPLPEATMRSCGARRTRVVAFRGTWMICRSWARARARPPRLRGAEQALGNR